MSRVVFWGAGNRLNTFFDYFKKHESLLKDDFLYIVDSDIKKIGIMQNGLMIYSVGKLASQDFDLLIITPLLSDDILNKVVELNLSVQIKGIDEYWAQIISEFQYEKFGCKEVSCNSIEATNEIIVYTAISKGYDDLKEPLVSIPNAKYVCFTDDYSIHSDVWNVRYVDFGKDVRRGIREYKICPHRFLKESDISVWVDGSVTIIGDINIYINTYLKNREMLLFSHPERICLYEEADVCIEQKKDFEQDILSQINNYREEKIPENYGLFCGGILVRNHNLEKISNAMELWWQHINNYSVRDQISLPYVIYKAGLKVDLNPQYIYSNEWFQISKHR